MSRASWAAIGQGVGAGLANAGKTFGEGYLKYLSTATQEQLKRDQVDKILSQPAKNIDPVQRVLAPIENMNMMNDPGAQPIDEDMRYGEGMPSINELRQSLSPEPMTAQEPKQPQQMNPVNPIDKLRAEAEDLNQKALQLERVGAKGEATQIRNQAKQKSDEANAIMKANAIMYSADKQQQQFDQRIQMEFHKESEKIYSKIQDEAKSAVRDLTSSETAKKSLATGNVNPKSIKGMARTFFKGTKWEEYFKNPDISTLEAASLTEYEGARQLFGGILSDADLRIIAGKVISADKTPAQNLAILEVRDLQNRAKIREAEIADQIIDANNGYRPRNFLSLIKKQLAAEFQEEAQETYANAMQQITGNTTANKQQSKSSGFTRMLNPADGKYYDVPNERLQ